VRSRLGLVALWALFAAASVGVGFGAAGLVGDPFTDPGGNQVTLSGTGDSPSAGSSTSPPATPSQTRGATPRSSTAPTPVVRSLTTRGGLVVGSCSRTLVTVSAAPTVGWAIEDLDGGPAQEARVRFERTGDGDGRVEVRARCVGGSPRFSVEDRTGSSGPGGGSSGSGGSGPG
jgi:hypothetical protein